MSDLNRQNPRRRMTDNQRFAILVPACLGIGVGLCVVVGLGVNAIMAAPGLSGIAPFLVVLLLLAGIAASCWSFIKLVSWLYRETY